MMHVETLNNLLMHLRSAKWPYDTGRNAKRPYDTWRIAK